MSQEKDGIPLEMAAILGLISADEYLDFFGEPRRAWPEVKDDSSGGYCAACDTFLESRGSYRKHMVRHQVIVPATAPGTSPVSFDISDPDQPLAALNFALTRLFGPTRS